MAYISNIKKLFITQRSG